MGIPHAEPIEPTPEDLATARQLHLTSIRKRLDLLKTEATCAGFGFDAGVIDPMEEIKAAGIDPQLIDGLRALTDSAQILLSFADQLGYNVTIHRDVNPLNPSAATPVVEVWAKRGTY
jgi:hypothetical protein